MMTAESCHGTKITPAMTYTNKGYYDPPFRISGMVGGKPESDMTLGKVLLVGLSIYAVYMILKRKGVLK